MRKLIIFFLPIFLYGFWKPQSNLPFEGSPSANIGACVNAISGRYFSQEADLVISGAQPLTLTRIYTGNKGDGWEFFPHKKLTVVKTKDREYIKVRMPSGAQFHFFPDGKNRYVFGYGEKSDGVCNTARGAISARTDVTNIHLLFEAASNRYIMVLPDGSCRIYHAPFKSRPHRHTYRLAREDLPNGNVIHYTYQSKLNFDQVWTASPSGSVYAVANFSYQDQTTTITTSDGQTLRYERGDHQELKRVIREGVPDEEIEYKDQTIKGRHLSNGQSQTVSLYKKSKNTVIYGKTIHIKKWPDWRIGRVKTIQTNLGPTYGFIYKPGLTKVYDAQGYLKEIHFNRHNYLTKTVLIQDKHPFATTKYTWDGSHLTKKRVHSKGQLIFSETIEYDPQGNPILSVIEGANDPPKVTKTTYTPSHLPKTIVMPGGVIKTLTYHKNTDLIQSEILTFEGKVLKKTEHAYNVDNVLISTTINDRLVTQITPKQGMPHIIEHLAIDPKRGERHLIKKEELTCNKRWQVLSRKVFDSQGALFSETRATFDPSGAPSSRTNALGETTHYENDPNGLCLREIDPKGIVKEFEYDAMQRLICTHLPDHDLHYAYDKLSRLRGETNLSSNWTEYTHDILGNIKETTTPGGAKTQSTYDPLGALTQTTDPLGNVTQYIRNLSGDPLQIIHPDGSIETFTYDEFGYLSSHTDRDGHKTKATHDPLGRKLSIIHPDGSTESWEYDLNSCLSHKDRHGNTTHYEYDIALRKTKEIHDDITISYTYDTMGRCIEETTYALGLPPRTLKKEYDRLDRIVATQESTGKKNHLTYDAHGNITQTITIIDGQKRQTKTQYDDFDRVIAQTAPLNRTTYTIYNDFYLNSDHRYVLQKITLEPTGILIEEIHNLDGLVIERTKKDPKGRPVQKETFEYDLKGQQTAIHTHIFPQETLHTTQITYDSAGRITAIDANGAQRSYTYTPQGHLKTFTKPNGQTLTTTYDPMGRAIATHSSDGTIAYTMTYGTHATPLLIDDNVQGTQTHRELDNRGRLISETLANGHTLTSTYNAYGQRTSLTLPNQTRITYTYDAHFLRAISYNDYTHHYLHYGINDQPTLERPIIPNSPTERTYTLTGRPHTLKSPHYQEELTYGTNKDLIIARTQKIGASHQEKTYTYDSLDQLITDSTHTYQWDSAYTRLPTSHPPDDSQTTYDAMGNLLQIDTVTYTYDPLGRCMSKETSSGTTTYIYDGQNEIGSYHNHHLHDLRILGCGPGAEIGAAILVQIAGSTYMPLHSLTGDLIALVDPQTEEIVATTTYTPFGETQNPLPSWGFQSKRHHSETGLYNFGRRYYDPKKRIFLTPDPKEFDLAVNRHAYLCNNPLGHIDPYGMEELQPPEMAPQPISHSLYYGLSICPPLYTLPDQLLAPQIRHNDQSHSAPGFFHSPAFHGTLQGINGLIEVGIGAYATLGTGGIGAGLAWPVFIHGLDQMITGFTVAFSGRFADTVTDQFLQKLGFSPQASWMIDNTCSMVGTMGCTAVIRARQLAVFPKFHLPPSAFQDKQNLSVLSNSRPLKSWTNSINPFRGKTFPQIDQMLRAKGFTTKGPNPLYGRGSYFSPTANRKYYLDYAGKTYKGGIIEMPHVDVHYKVPINGIEKQRFPLGEFLYGYE